MKQHQFYDKDSDGYYMVTCKSTGGSFSTRIWKNEITKHGMCPCCNESVKK
jgi:hypothetical protein